MLTSSQDDRAKGDGDRESDGRFATPPPPQRHSAVYDDEV
jgi:hypothetical protein